VLGPGRRLAGREVQTRHHADGPFHGRRGLTLEPPLPRERGYSDVREKMVLNGSFG